MQQINQRSSNRPAFHVASVALLLALLAGAALVFHGGIQTHASSPAVQISPNSGPYGTIT